MIDKLTFGDFLIRTCFWQSTVFLLSGLLGSYLLRHHSARAHRVLFLAIIATVIVPVASLLVKHYKLGLFMAEPIVIQPSAESYVIHEPTGTIPNETSKHNPASINRVLHPAMTASKAAKFPWHLTLLYTWITASLILAVRLLVTFALGLRLLKRAAPLNCNKIEQAIDQAKTKFGIRNDVKIYTSAKISSPVIWCWKRTPILLVPSEVRLPDIDWTGVLCHELAHYKRRDHVVGLLAELTVCLLPWQLLLWLAKSRLISLSEQSCDDWVIAVGQSSTDYAESLLDLMPCGQIAFAPGITGSRKEMAKRIRRILKDSCGNPRTGRIWASIVCIFATCLAVGITFAQTRPADPFHNIDKNGDIEQLKHKVSSFADMYSPNESALDTSTHIAAFLSAKWKERKQAPTAVIHIDPITEPTILAFTKLLSDEEWKVRRTAAEALATVGPAAETAIPALIKLLSDQEWQVRQAAAEALTAIGPAAAPAVPSLMTALDDVEWLVRKPAAEALAAIGTASKPATTHLISALNDEEWQVRKPAALALGAIGPAAAEAIPTLIKRLDDPEWQVRYAVADALEKISVGDKSSVPEIIEVLLDQEWKKRQSAAQALQKSLQEDKP
jgi:HEAT repeat protein/beta-lactamase regulating signal transducer with metallopeptidase domain